MNLFDWLCVITFWGVWIFTCPLVCRCVDCKHKK